ncbi:MAG: tetratricopeptide repeat protein [Pseudomonadota bacterium]
MNGSSLRRKATTAIFFSALLMVAGCKTTETPLVGQALDSLTGSHDISEDRLSTAAANAIAEGKTDEALTLYERLYTQTHSGFFLPDDVTHRDIALNYAQLLRRTGKAQRALDVLAPFMKDTGSRPRRNYKPDPVVLNEYAAGSIETGDFEKAEKLLNQVLEDKDAAKAHADAHNLLGIILDAKDQHKEAEQSFRQALDNWKGDKTSVMNNLGLCLASQGMFDESLMTLRQALIMAPQKQEIAGNIRMVTDLRKSVIPAAPVGPGEKKSHTGSVKQ